MRKTVLSFVTYFGLLSSSQVILAKSDENQQGFAVAREMAHQFLSETDEAAYSGVVSEVFDSGGYSYIRFKTEDKEYWAATKQVPIKVGDHVVLDEVYPMHGFHSKSLDRTFDFILFTSQVMKKTQVTR